MKIRPQGPQIGVEVSDVDLKTITASDFQKIYQAWLDHNVLVVTNQDLTIPDFIKYSERFGTIVPHPSKSTRHPDHPVPRPRERRVGMRGCVGGVADR